jgi:ElaA protein
VSIRHGRWADLPPGLLHDLVRLRIDVFVVEQGCAYPELDGRDVEPGTEHWWVGGPGGEVLACLRVLAEPDGAVRVGRVCSRPDARGRGLAGRLVDAALARSEGRDVVLDAQAHLAGFYARRGFEPTGPQFDDGDGIPHVPMRRRAQAQASAATRSASGTRGPV